MGFKLFEHLQCIKFVLEKINPGISTISINKENVIIVS